MAKQLALPTPAKVAAQPFQPLWHHCQQSVQVTDIMRTLYIQIHKASQHLCIPPGPYNSSKALWALLTGKEAAAPSVLLQAPSPLLKKEDQARMLLGQPNLGPAQNKHGPLQGVCISCPILWTFATALYHHLQVAFAFTSILLLTLQKRNGWVLYTWLYPLHNVVLLSLQFEYSTCTGVKP